MAWFSIFKYKNWRKVVLMISSHIFLDLIINLWNPWELSLHFKKYLFWLFEYQLLWTYAQDVLPILNGNAKNRFWH